VNCDLAIIFCSMARRPRCQVCRSKRWHRDAASGMVVCEEGHFLQARPSCTVWECSLKGLSRATCKKPRAKKLASIRHVNVVTGKESRELPRISRGQVRIDNKESES
jgi:hypothetical protein